YISIQIDVGRGGGYRPHNAVDVFNKNYGDCKDKANLMRAMLKSLGVESYPVVIYSGDPNSVEPEWPSPQQFNHCIIAVKVSDETQASTIVKHPSLGRLLIFDPTDDDTPIGDLPDYEQGSYALIVAGDAGELMKMPVTPPEANRLDRAVEAELGADGTLTAKVSERSFGQAAVGERRLFKRAERPQYVKYIERWITQTAPSANVLKSEPNDDARAGKFALDVEFKSPNYAQLMRGKLMVFKPAIVSRRSSVLLTEAKRKNPVVLDSEAYDETVRIKLPEGFDVDEMPDALEVNQPFGNYAAKCEVKEGHLIFRRSLALRAGTIPVENYPQVRSFFERIRSVEQTPVVLVRK
ncbi:MAG TPA: transglutaminase domain-containing protein, partial [Blastocatellia bacterium]|nr:transglutaminase domain-containing protein [Blastocatellia bacterium]